MHESIISNMTLEELEVHYMNMDKSPVIDRLLELNKEINDNLIELRDEETSLNLRIAELETEVEDLESEIDELT